MPQGTKLGLILFSVMLNDIQTIDSDSSTLVKFADDLTLTVLVKGIQDQAPLEVQNILSWAYNNLMTINLTKTKEIVVKGKVERSIPTVTFGIKQEEFLKLLRIYFHSSRTNWDKQIDALLSKAGRRMHIYKCARNMAIVLTLFTTSSIVRLYLFLLMAFQYGVLLVMISMFPKLTSFRKEQFVVVSLRRSNPS